MERIAIIGSGIAGLGCAWFLHRKFEISLFESDSRIGGHSHTVSIPEGKNEVSLDTGFMVYNEVTYPHLTRLFKELDVDTKPTSMSFSVQHLPSSLEWKGSGFNTLFAQRKNLFNPRHWRFLLQLNRFNKEAVPALEEVKWSGMTLAEYVEERGYGRDFLERYLIPISSAVWSTPPEKMLDFPAVTLLRFWFNHGFLGLGTQHPWRTVKGGSTNYVQKVIKPFRERVHIDSPVKRITRSDAGVEIEVGENHEPQNFDRVILATHAPTSLRMLAEPTPLENEVLPAFTYQPNQVAVHSDDQIMPQTKRSWASWNYRADSSASPTTHYWMNSLQGVSEDRNYFVSLNASREIDRSLIHRHLDYEHPLFNLEAIEAQKKVPRLNVGKQTYFAGAWTRYGFHEDGLLSAVNVAKNILGGDPWELR